MSRTVAERSVRRRGRPRRHSVGHYLWRVRTWLRRELDSSDRIPLLALVTFALAITVMGSLWPDWVPYTVMVLPMFAGHVSLTPKTLPWYIIGCLFGVCVMIAAQPQVSERSVLRVVVTFVLGLIILVSSFRRGRLGVSAPRSEAMFLDLRDRIARQGALPQMPSGWHAESVLRSSGGTAFSGDFIVARGAEDGAVLDLVVVDVSGKGVQAGTRALLLSGAFGALLTAAPPEEFLPSASRYLNDQQWVEGFATAIHLHLDTRSGEFALRKAGHPPAIWLKAGSGLWEVVDSEGPVLGIVDDPEFEVVTGTLRSGDALMLYTDGLVERSERDIDSGIDRLAGRGQLLQARGFDRGAETVMDQVGMDNDDRALVLVHRL